MRPIRARLTRHDRAFRLNGQWYVRKGEWTFAAEHINGTLYLVGLVDPPYMPSYFERVLISGDRT